MQTPSRFNLSRLCLLTVLILLLSACGPVHNGKNVNIEKADENHQVLISSLVGAGYPDIRTFDPADVSDISSGRAISAVFTGLVSLDDNGNVKTQMASGWHISDGGLTYTFTLSTTPQKKGTG